MGASFAVFAAFYYWVEKITGRRYDQLIGAIQFWSLFIGVNLTFFPMHFLGIAGMPRRIPDYPDSYQGWNKVASLGSMISMISIIIFLVGVYKTITGPESEERRVETRIITLFNDDLGYERISGVRTLEWAMSTPPSYHHFDHIPMVNDVVQLEGEKEVKRLT